jgi:hypothetical protein
MPTRASKSRFRVTKKGRSIDRQKKGTRISPKLKYLRAGRHFGMQTQAQVEKLPTPPKRTIDVVNRRKAI